MIITMTDEGGGLEVADRSELAVRADVLAELDSAVERLLASAANASEDVLVDRPIALLVRSRGDAVMAGVHGSTLVAPLRPECARPPLHVAAADDGVSEWRRPAICEVPDVLVDLSDPEMHVFSPGDWEGRTAALMPATEISGEG